VSELLIERIGAGRSRARRYSEVVGYITAHPRQHDPANIRVILTSTAGQRRYSLRADRACYFSGRVLQDEYVVRVHGSFSSKINSILLGKIRLGPGTAQLELRLTGGSVKGYVDILSYRFRGVSQLTLRERCSVWASEVVLSRDGGFAFSGLGEGTYELSGEVLGAGDVKIPEIRLEARASVNIGKVPIEPRSYVCFQVRDASGRAANSGLSGRLWPRNGSREDGVISLDVLGPGRGIARYTEAGDYAYELLVGSDLRTRGCVTLDGESQLIHLRLGES
jgi:hypothetical protein